MFDSSEKISIVLPTFNGARFVKRSIDSCLNQTYENIELVIVDDCSDDETPKIIKSYNDQRIKYLRHEKNKGLPASLNTGFSQVTGEYLTWTSDDNYYSKDAFEREIAFIKEKKCSFVFCDFYRFKDEEPSKLKIVQLPDVLNLAKNNDVGPCILYAEKVKKMIGEYSEEAELAEDYDYWLRVSRKFRMFHLAEPLYYYREHHNSLSLARFYEVRGAEILVKIKNRVPYENSLYDLTSLCTERHQKNSAVQRIARVYYKRKIRNVLKDFKSGKSSFAEARVALRNIMEHRSRVFGK